jgi:hypothetical protein
MPVVSRYILISLFHICITSSLPVNSSVLVYLSMTTTLMTSFATFTGKNGDEVIQYLGVKYASLEDQLSPPEMMTTYDSGVVDATEFG